MTPVPTSGLAEALHLEAGGRHHIAIVGGGGKTTILHALGAQLSGRSVLTTTTKMGHDQHRGLPVLIAPDTALLRSQLAMSSPVMVWAAVDGHRAIGVEPQVCDSWFADPDLVHNIVIEADGSRRRPFKAPAAYEPVVPTSTTTMVSVIGVDALNRPIAESCHRPDIVAQLTDAAVSEPLTAERAAAVLLHPEGARRAMPAAARFCVVVTKVAGAHVADARALTDALGAIEPSTPVVWAAGVG